MSTRGREEVMPPPRAGIPGVSGGGAGIEGFLRTVKELIRTEHG
jgi:hypothetical protein